MNENWAMEATELLPALKKTVVLGCAAVLIFRNVYLIRPMYLQTNTIFDVSGVVKEGPAVGIFSTYMGPYMQNETIKTTAHCSNSV